MSGAAARGTVSMSRVYRDAALRLPARVLNYMDSDLSLGRATEYALRRKLGRGRFGEVFDGVHVPTSQRCVVKVLKPLANLGRFKREVSLLQVISRVRDTSTLLDVVQHEPSGTLALVFPWMDNMPIKEMYEQLTLDGARAYMYRLLRALDAVHALGIMHRDVKPNNVLVDATTNSFCLIDWGLADLYLPGQPNNVRISTRPFKAPELLLGMRYYDYSVDLWAAGCVAAGLFFLRHPFFFRRGDEKTKLDPLIRHAKVLGTAQLEEYMHDYGLKFTHDQLAGIKRKRPRVPWSSFVDDVNRRLVCDEGLNLLDGLLSFDHQKRLTAREALAHPFFDPIRQGKVPMMAQSADVLSGSAVSPTPDSNESSRSHGFDGFHERSVGAGSAGADGDEASIEGGDSGAGLASDEPRHGSR